MCALTTTASPNLSSDSQRRFSQNEAAKLDPIIFRDGRAAKRSDDDDMQELKQGSVFHYRAHSAGRRRNDSNCQKWSSPPSQFGSIQLKST